MSPVKQKVRPKFSLFNKRTKKTNCGFFGATMFAKQEASWIPHLALGPPHRSIMLKIHAKCSQENSETVQSLLPQFGKWLEVG